MTVRSFKNNSQLGMLAKTWHFFVFKINFLTNYLFHNVMFKSLVCLRFIIQPNTAHNINVTLIYLWKWHVIIALLSLN
jgi:hypothetical protein